MTQEEKELLLKDLLGRVLYGVKVDYHTNIFTLGYNLYLNNSDVAFENYPMLYFLENIESVKPYLRPMSSMTREEEAYWYYHRHLVGDDIFAIGYDNPTCCIFECFEWLNSHHFDYGGLIIKGLALEAPKDMYKF